MNMQIAELWRRLRRAEQQNNALERELRELKSLNETLELLAMVASKTENAVIILDAAGQIEWVNDSFVSFTGYKYSEVRGADLGTVLFKFPTCEVGAAGAEQASHVQQEELTRALGSGCALTQETRLRGSNGCVFWASISVTPVIDENGIATRWIGIISDVTKWREAQDSLQLAKEVAEAASRAKSDFLANMSHEVRTPMNVIIGMTELMLDMDTAPDQREYLLAIKNSADSLLWFLNDVLDLSKIEAGKIELESVSFCLPELMNNALQPTHTQARVKGLALSWSLAPETPRYAVGDPGRLQQILINLVSNAIKFTESGEVVISVESISRSGPQVELHFSVRDTGIGISPEKLGTVFESFTQADSSTTRRFGGTGLGLSIASQLTELMGGRMWVESARGQGSTFHFVIPLRIPEKGNAGHQPGASLTHMTSLQSLHVLVVDDNPGNRLLAARILAKRGHLVVQAANAKKALKLVRERDFHVVLMDAQMPEMDGFQATAALRKMERKTHKHVPVIALTASAMKGDRERCLAAGMDAYISKPFNARELERLVETLGTEAPSRATRMSEMTPRIPTSDFSAALARLQDNADILQEQMRLFVEDSPALLARIQSAIDAADPEKLQLFAHRLKGFAATFDAERVVQIARALEEMGSAGKLVGAGAVYAELESSVQRFLQQLNHYLQAAETDGS